MEKIGFVLLLTIAYSLHLSGQTTDSIPMLQERIAARDSILATLKKSELTDSLQQQVTDYKLLVDLLERQQDECQKQHENLRKELSQYDLLTSTDTLIFHANLDSLEAVPYCFQGHLNLIKKIVEMRDRIEKVENDIMRISNAVTVNVRETIRDNIAKDVDDIYTLFEQISNMDQSSLSEEQKAYFQPGLTERYNQFSKYFE